MPCHYECMPTETFANVLPTQTQATLTAPIGASDTAIVVSSTTVFPTSPQFRILIDAELMLVTAVAGSVFTVTRALEGTVAVPHVQGSVTSHILTAGALAQLSADTIAAVPSPPVVTFAGDLAGSNTTQNVKSLGTGAATVSTAGAINWANTSTVTLGQSAVTTASTVAPPITISSASATGSASTGGDINLNVGSSTTGAAKINFKSNGVLKGYVYSGGSCVATGADGLSLWSASGMQASLWGDQGLGLSANAGNFYCISNLSFIFNQVNSTNILIIGQGGGIYVGSTKTAIYTQQDNTTASATGSPLLIQSQSCTGATSIGGDLELKCGAGTSANGNLKITNVATTVGAQTSGAAAALPAQPAGYVSVTINGTVRKLPYY
jgi:hypothetical protein